MQKKLIMSVLCLAAVIVVFSSFSLAEGQGKKAMLANNGNAMYGVYVSSEADAIEQHAAEELTDYLTQVTGAPFELSSGGEPPNGPMILVGQHDLVNELVPELTYDRLGDDGFIIDKRQQYIVIAGSESRGTMNGVNFFLDEYVGVKWFSPDYTVIPDREKLLVNVDNDIQVPRYEYREMYVNDGSDEHYRAHNLLNGKFRDRHGRVPESDPGIDSWSDYWPADVHNFHKLVPDTQYHYGNQLLAMNENVRRIAAENLIDIIQERIENGEDPSFSFSQQDTGWNPDPESQAFADQHGGTLAAPIFDMVGDVANRVKAVIPEARIGTLAYQFTYPAPTDMTLPDNVVITAAPISKDHGRAINRPENQSFGDNLTRWAEMSDHIVIWDYLTDFSGGGYIMPYPNIYAMSETIQFAAELPAVKGYFGQLMHNTRAPSIDYGLDALRTWVGAKLLWNPQQDVADLIQEFATGYYGDAAPYMMEYIEVMHQSLEESGSKLIGISTSATSDFLSFEAMRQADELFDQAVAAVADHPTFLEHVQKARISVDYIILLRHVDFLHEALEQNVDWDPDFENRLQRFKTYTADITDYRINANIEQLYELLSVERVVPEVPELVKDLPDSDWKDFQDSAFRLYAPVGTKVVQDPKASDHAAARVTGSTNAWAIQLSNTTLPQEGQWKLYANVRVDPGDGAPGDTAFLHGIYPPIENEEVAKFEDVSDGEYHLFELPGLYEFDPDISNHYAWLAPPNSSAIEYLYVDRIIAIKQ